MVIPEIGLVVHATHEAGLKVGGIGAVLDGLLSQPSYNRVVNRTVLVGPFKSDDPLEMERLRSPGNRLSIIYFTDGGPSPIGHELARAFERIELYYHVRILYGKRGFGDYEHEVLLIDPADVVISVVNKFKFLLWEHLGIDSRRYESVDEYAWYISAAEPSFAALQALVGKGEIPKPPQFRASTAQSAFLLAHEWLGLPLAFSALFNEPKAYRLAFYAHEVATVRSLVEGNPGYDTRFYNVMSKATKVNLFLEDVFGEQSHLFKHAMLLAAGYLDKLLAVSALTMDELRFLSPAIAGRPTALVYNGVPSAATRVEGRVASKDKLERYALALIGNRPTWIFTHVTRLVPSKGLWRDLTVMKELDARLAARGESAVLYTLSSAIPGGRRADDVLQWEAGYGWPVNHRDDNGDLVGPEVDYYAQVLMFNRTARASQIILFNQFGWSPDRCGRRMPEDMTFDDLRRGTDLEFGQSIYEPFGIGQLEPLSSGAICNESSVCGNIGFFKHVGCLDAANLLVADYTTLPKEMQDLTLEELLALGAGEREQVEAAEAVRVADRIMERLPRTPAQIQHLIEDGFSSSQRMSWKVVVEDMLLPAMLSMF